MEYIVKLPKQGINAEIFRKETGWDLVARDGILTIVGDCTEDEALIALKNHNPQSGELSISEKLASVGLSIDDLKAALGL
jgi:hypothetical protein